MEKKILGYSQKAGQTLQNYLWPNRSFLEKGSILYRILKV